MTNTILVQERQPPVSVRVYRPESLLVHAHPPRAAQSRYQPAAISSHDTSLILKILLRDLHGLAKSCYEKQTVASACEMSG
jgi:hypothetical protein